MRMSGYKMDIALYSFAKKFEEVMLRIAWRNTAHGFRKIERKIEGHAPSDFAFKEEDVAKRRDKAGPCFGISLVVRQLAERVRSGVAALAVTVRVDENRETGGDELVGGALLFRRVEIRSNSGFSKLAMVEIEQFAPPHQIGPQKAQER